VAALAKQHGCEVIGDIELLARAQRGASYVGVTGTNGKSTTTALIGHVLELAGRDVQTGGNIGLPVLEFEPLEAGGIYVLELSSYQLETIFSITFDVAVLLNVSPDHLDRHGGFDGYVKAKRLVFHRQTKPRSAVIGVDDKTCQGIWRELAAADEQSVIPISGATAVAGGVYARNGTLIDDTDGQAIAVLDLGEVATLPGIHNRQNAAAKALACYGAIYWIAGGQAKETGLEGLEPFYGKIAHAFLIGEAEAAFAQALDGQVAHSRCGDLGHALEAARARALAEARPEAVVLLSPACASFDQYENFEARGEAFRHLVEALPGERSDLETAPGAPGGRMLQ
jgi:UDP-N-acetylmuramoylalanine--D-glutamate ligase